MTISVYAHTDSPPQDITLGFYQFFGSGGGGAASAFTQIGATQTLSDTSWKLIEVTGFVPLAGGSIGANKDDVLYVYFGYPINVNCSIDHTKMALYLGDKVPQLDYQSNDQIASIISSPRPGDIKATMSNYVPSDWVLMNDQTIGNPFSSADVANYDLFPLYSEIWNATNTNATTQAWAPVTSGRGASATADFAANKSMKLLYASGAILGNVGTPNQAVTAYGPNQQGINWVRGQPFGEELHVLTEGELAAHTHNIAVPDDAPGVYMSQVSASVNRPSTATSSTGNDEGHNTIQPTLRTIFLIKR